MRPIKLSMTAFGPFVNTESVDFEAFGERPLFLINGDTGAGKTTILDAICFALYGQTTGKEREAMQMRCDYADDNTATSVEFTFELGSKQYRIMRMPEQTRAKKSGEGTTTQKARAELWQLEGDGETVLVPEKVTEATQKIEALTGLQVDQFRQVMVLPQGQFRRLLMADSKDREQIFSQLFETGIYKKIEDKLKQRASHIVTQVRTLENEQQGVLQTVGFAEVDALEASIAEVTPAVGALATLKSSKETAYLTGLSALNEAKGLDENFVKLQGLSTELDTLERQKFDIESKEKRLNQADQASKIKPAFVEQARLTSELHRAVQAKDSADKTWRQRSESLKQAVQALEKTPALDDEKDQLKQRIDSLKSYRGRTAKLQEAQHELKHAQAAFDSSAFTYKDNIQQVTQLKQQQEQGELEKKRLEALLEHEVEVAAKTQTLAQAVKLKLRYEELLKQKMAQEKLLASTRVMGEAAGDDEARKKTALDELTMRWHSGQAAILALRLELNQPCAVCGSLEHPAPAKSSVDLPTDRLLETAKQALEAARAKLQSAREDYRALKAHLDGLEPQLAELLSQLGEFAGQSREQLQQQYQVTSDHLKALQQSRKQLSAMDAQLGALKQALAVADESSQQTQQQNSELQARLQKQQTHVELAQNELPVEYRQSNQLESDISTAVSTLARLTQQIDSIKQAHMEASKQHSTAEAHLEGLKNQCDTLNTNADAAIKKWQEVLNKSVFVGGDDFAQADISLDEQARLKEAIAAYKAQRQTLTGAIQEREKILAGKQRPDLIALQVALEAAFESKNQAEQDWQQADKKLNHLQEAKKSFDKLAAKQALHEQEYKVIGTLSDVANGSTGNKISLQRFVLGVLLDGVLLAASSRLTLMSKGRYHLLRKEDRAKGNKASGLEMEVEDTYTGKLRAVSTLSGGESFLASLSLALGLSDVVQAYAGGIRLETLFIDEGFGSLDSATLDLAIKTLIDLRNTGRMVGIISHVAELKEQIAMRLDVVSGRQGSKIELVY